MRLDLLLLLGLSRSKGSGLSGELRARTSNIRINSTAELFPIPRDLVGTDSDISIDSTADLTVNKSLVATNSNISIGASNPALIVESNLEADGSINVGLTADLTVEKNLVATDSDISVSSTIPALTVQKELEGDGSISIDSTADLTVGGGLWTPANLTNLVAWYDASDVSTVTLNGSNVSQIDDKSGNGYHVAQSSGADQPLYANGVINGLNAIQGNGVAAHLENYSIPLYDPKLVAGVIQVVDNNGGGWFDATSSGDHSTLGFGIGKGDSTFDNNGFRLITLRHGVAWNPSNTFLTAGDSHLFSTGSAYSNLFMDGTSIDTFNAGKVPTTGVTFGGSYFGSRTTNDYTGEYVIADTSDTAEKEKLEGYLAHKWGTEASLPVSHPYKSSPPTI